MNEYKYKFNRNEMRRGIENLLVRMMKKKACKLMSLTNS